MLSKKLLFISTLIIFSYGYSPVALACENKYSYAASGSLEKSDLDRLKKEFLNARRSIKNPDPIKLSDVWGILGFSGERTKTTNNGRVEHRIWVDRDNCKRKIKASFRDGELVKFQSYGF